VDSFNLQAMRYLFNDQAYPIVAKANEIAPLLSRTGVKAVAYRNPAIRKSLAALKEGITAENNADIAHRYALSPQQDKRDLAAGRTLYLESFKTSDISAEASLAGIAINPDVLNLLTSRANDMRKIFTQVYRRYTGDMTSPIGGNILFTPKDGVGRAPEIHADFLSLAGHWSIALATLDILRKEPDQQMWDAVNRKKQNLLSPEERAKTKQWLIQKALENPDDFSPTEFGDLMITKGQRFVDLDKPEDRAKVCVHVSSHMIPLHGQAAALFYPRVPKPQV
jgi:hypothetical protein